MELILGSTVPIFVTRTTSVNSGLGLLQDFHWTRLLGIVTLRKGTKEGGDRLASYRELLIVVRIRPRKHLTDKNQQRFTNHFCMNSKCILPFLLKVLNIVLGSNNVLFYKALRHLLYHHQPFQQQHQTQ